LSTRLPAAKRREQLLTVAAKLFAERGYARATTSELAKAAGVTEPIIYRHFASKRELFIAIIERSGEHTIKLWERVLADAKDPGERLIRLLGANTMVTDSEGRDAYRVMLQAISEAEDPVIAEALREHFNQLHSFLETEIKDAQDTRQVGRRFGPDIIAWLLIHLAMGYGVLDAMGVAGDGVYRGSDVQDVIRKILLARERAD